MQHKAKKFSTRARTVTAVAAVAAVGAGVAGAVSASADTPA
ncbi:heme-binding protein, partial [Streptomyces sp. SID625]|nr:heme-binding protein [Streptomyces sp. SID625]